MFKVSVIGVDEFVKNTREFASEFVNTDQEIRAACFNTIVLISDRVQQRGEKTDGGKIGNYSTDTISFKAITDSFKSMASKNVLSKRISKYGDADEFYGGYKEIREELGLQTAFVDLTFTGEMMDSLILEPQGGGKWSVGFAGQAASDKAEWNEMKYGTIFQLSDSEYNDVMDDLLNNIQKKIDAAY